MCLISVLTVMRRRCSCALPHILLPFDHDLDYSLMRAFRFPDSRLQVGLIGYGAWQTTAKTGPQITSAQEAQRYRVNALGVGLNFALPARKVTLSFKYFDEFSNQWTYQGYSVQISAGVGF